jgi:hypothetical protein
MSVPDLAKEFRDNAAAYRELERKESPRAATSVTSAMRVSEYNGATKAMDACADAVEKALAKTALCAQHAEHSQDCQACIAFAMSQMRPNEPLPIVMAASNTKFNSGQIVGPRAEVSVTSYLCTTEQAMAANESVHSAIKALRAQPATTPAIDRNLLLRAIADAGFNYHNTAAVFRVIRALGFSVSGDADPAPPIEDAANG